MVFATPLPRERAFGGGKPATACGLASSARYHNAMRIVRPDQLYKDRTRESPRDRQGRPEFDIATILVWAENHKRRTGRWPKALSGPIRDVLGESWSKVDAALRYGRRGLGPLGGSSLAKLLAEERGVRNVRDLPPLTEERIVAWADAHRCRTGKWPTINSGELVDAPGETWANINMALTTGTRGLRGRASLAKLLSRRRGIRHNLNAPALTVEKVLALAVIHHRRTGKWPKRTSGKVAGTKHERWSAIDTALRDGVRGLRGGSSLARLLHERRGVRNKSAAPRLTVRQILKWAKLHYARTGKWPSSQAGQVNGEEETWRAVDLALREGLRGLRGNSSLPRFLLAHLDRLSATAVWSNS
jgi:hypothetical protein